MTNRVIPLIDARVAISLPRAIGNHVDQPAVGHVADQLGRPLRDLRISVTDRCNFRCTYCMPKEVFNSDYRFLRHSDLLTFEEIARLAAAFVQHGVEKIRLTGGEPLLRKDLHKLIATLDGLDDATFRRMNDVDFPVRDVLEGVEAATAAGLAPVKINMVVKRGVNEGEIVAMARHFRGTGHIVRFIEYMDVGTSNGWRMDEVVPSSEVLRYIAEEFPLEPLDANYTGEVAERWRYRDGQGEIGAISSVSQAFCRECTRARLSTEGKLFLCLFANQGHDLRTLLRGNGQQAPMTDSQLETAIGRIWSVRDDRYSELRTEATAKMPKVEMSYIGG